MNDPMRVGENVQFKSEDREVRSADVCKTYPGEPDVVDLNVHAANGMILHGVARAPRATSVDDRETPGFWWPKS